MRRERRQWTLSGLQRKVSWKKLWHEYKQVRREILEGGAPLQRKSPQQDGMDSNGPLVMSPEMGGGDRSCATEESTPLEEVIPSPNMLILEEEKDRSNAEEDRSNVEEELEKQEFDFPNVTFVGNSKPRIDAQKREERASETADKSLKNVYSILEDLGNISANITLKQLLYHSPEIREELKYSLGKKIRLAYIDSMGSPNFSFSISGTLYKNCILDGGANCNIISAQITKDKKLSISPCGEIYLKLADGTYVRPLGEVNVTVEYEGRGEIVELLVLANPGYDILLGRPWLKKVDAITHWRDDRYSIELMNRQFEIVPNVHEKDTIMDARFADAKVCNEEEFIRRFDFGGEEEALKQSLVSAFQTEFHDLFVDNIDELKVADVEPVDIETLTDRGIITKMKRFSSPEIVEIRRQVEALENFKKVKKSVSDWRFNIVLVGKSDNSLRFCVNYRPLNEVTVKDSYPIPHMESILDQLAGRRYFTTLDLFKGFWQIPLSEETMAKTTFGTPFGSFCWTVLPMGLMNAPAVFQRIMEKYVQPVDPEHIAIYIDDLALSEDSLRSMVRLMFRTFTRLRERRSSM